MRNPSSRRSSRSAFLLGVLAAFLLLFLGGYAYLRYGHPPVAVADAPFPDEAKIVHIPLEARIDRELQTAPIDATPENVLAGAHVYVAQCAMCHGTPATPSSFGKWEYPAAPQLWKQHGKVVGVSDDPAGETYWKVANGIRLTGMPSFSHQLSVPEMWQVSLLLANADKPQSAEVTDVFTKADALRVASEGVGPVAANAGPGR